MHVGDGTLQVMEYKVNSLMSYLNLTQVNYLKSRFQNKCCFFESLVSLFLI